MKKSKLTRRQVVQTGICATAGLMVPWKKSRADSLAPGLSDPAAQPKFVEVVPNALDPGFIYDTNSGHISVGVDQTVQQTGLVDSNGNKLYTTVWGYGTNGFYTWPGRTFQQWSGVPLEVEWRNRLGGLPYPITSLDGEPVLDSTLHWAYSLKGLQQYDYQIDGVPIVPHLHGGHSDSIYDGNPEYFFSPNFGVVGPRWVSRNYYYKNDQQAGTLWYHDHTLGITRLNVYTGMAGFYILRDAYDTGECGNPLDLPAYPYEAAFAIQDRMFKDNGELFYPAFPGDPFYDEFIVSFPGGGPTALAEFFGDHMLVNGKIWPKMDVEPRNYRLRLLNGCDSRFLAVQFFEVPAGETDFANAVQQLPFTVVGSDQGLASSPTTVDTLLVETGSRYDIILDFRGVAADNRVIMKNIAGDSPFGGEIPGEAGFGETDRIMAFDVVLPFNYAVDDVSPTGINFGPMINSDVTRVRQVALFEGMDEFGRLQPLLGTAEAATDYRGNPINWPDTPIYDSVGLTGQIQGSIAWHSPTTENPALGSTEIWEIYNSTGDAHPIHLHLVNFEVLDRRRFTADVVDQAVVEHNGDIGSGFRLENIQLQESVVVPEIVENTPKDMVTALPDQVTRIKATFDKPGRYVWHCHILSHEDHEMMRVLHVGPGARGFVDFCAYGFAGRVTLENDATVDDNIGASGRVELKQRARVSSGTVISTWDSIKLAKEAVVEGDVIAIDKIDLDRNATIAGTTYEYTAASGPLTPYFSVAPGGDDIQVSKGKSLVLAPGDYAKLNVKKTATLRLSSGTYRFEEFKMDKESVVELDTSDGPIIVEVQNDVALKSIEMILLGDSEAKNVLFAVAKRSVSLGKQGSYVGTFLAPCGDVTLDADAILTGAAYGANVKIKNGALLQSTPAVDLVISYVAQLP